MYLAEDHEDDGDYEEEPEEEDPDYDPNGRQYLYSRQRLVQGIRVPFGVTVIGCGGVGSYVAIFMALLGSGNINLVDHDVVEESNRNRVLFRYYDVTDTKVNALNNIISVIRPNIVLRAHPCKIEDVPDSDRELIMRSNAVFDCRDIVDVLPEWVPKCKITGGYDGKRVTMHLNPDLSRIFSVGAMEYTTTPSYCLPPALIGILISLYSTSPALQVPDERIVSFDVDKLFVEVLDHDRV